MSAAVHSMYRLWGTAATYVLPEAALPELKQQYEMAATQLLLEIPRLSQAVNLGWLLLVPGVGPLSKKYGCWGLNEAGYLFERILEVVSMSPDLPFIRKSSMGRGGTESLGISRVGQTVLDELMESQIWHQPASSVVLWG